MIRSLAVVLAFAAGLATGHAGRDAGRGPPHPRPLVGVVVDRTRGAEGPLAPAIGREIAALRADGVDVRVRVTRSPSETVAASATLVALGARRLVVHGADVPTLAPLARRVPLELAP